MCVFEPQPSTLVVTIERGFELEPVSQIQDPSTQLLNYVKKKKNKTIH